MRKQISKKRKGVMNSMHHNSRDSKRLHKAQVREERLEKLADARKKKDQPLRAYSLFSIFELLECASILKQNECLGPFVSKTTA